MNFGGLLKAFDAVVALRSVTRRLKDPNAPPADPGTALGPAAQGLAGHIEARLTNVVVAALKEAFDRDHARLELERAQMEEQQRRANEALRLELHRQTIDREVGRLRLLAGTAMVGWIASVILLGWRLPLASPLARVSLVVGWLLLLGALGSSFQAMGRTSGDAAPTALPMWLLLTGLGATAMTLLL